VMSPANKTATSPKTCSRYGYNAQDSY